MRRGARLGFLLAVLCLSLVAYARCVGVGGPPPEVHLSSFDAGTREAPRPSQGCGRTGPASATSHDVIESPEPDGQKRKRSYELVLPAHYDPRHAYPLVVAFHGSGGNGSGFRRYARLEDLSNDGVITVYPDAVVRRVWGENFATHWGKSEDLPLVDGLVARMKSSLCIDESRIFAFGWSSGGYFANQLGCVRPDVFRAIVSLSGGGPENVTCTHPMAAFFQHDRDDGSVAFSTGKESREIWRKTNHCSGTLSERDGCTIYDGCAAPVVWCETSGNGHGPSRSGTTAAWTFLGAF